MAKKKVVKKKTKKRAAKKKAPARKKIAKKRVNRKRKKKKVAKKAPHRPTKLTKAIALRVIKSILRGSYVETAAAAAGINKTTFYDWLKQGRRLLDRLEKGEKITGQKNFDLMTFSNAIEKAQARSEERDVRVIDKAGQDGIWQASAWRLERKNHPKWGRKLAITDADGGSIVENAAKAWAGALQEPTDGSGEE